MISVYANFFIPTPESGLTGGNQEALLFTIPNQNEKERLFQTAKVNNEIGNAGNFEFSVHAKHMYYNIWKHMRTLMRVEYDGETIFYGRVLTIDRDMFRTKRIHCEGAYTFFMDSVFEGQKEGFTITLQEYLEKLIAAHNECMADVPEKQIQLGEVPGHYTGATVAAQQIDKKDDRQKFAASKGYKTVKEWLEELVQDYGGHMRVRYTNGTLYLDWLKLYYQSGVNNQTMSVSSNVIDLSDTVEVDNIFTHIIPVGKNGKYIGGGGGSGGGGGTKYHVYASPYNAGGTCSASPTEAAAGAKITLSAKPKAGYWLDRWVATGDIMPYISGNSFTMPKCDVWVSAVFTDQKEGTERVYLDIGDIRVVADGVQISPE